MWTRDVRLTDTQLRVARGAMTDRRKELERRLKRNSYDGKPGMKDRVVTELAEVRELERVFEHNLRQLGRQAAEKLRPQLTEEVA